MKKCVTCKAFWGNILHLRHYKEMWDTMRKVLHGRLYDENSYIYDIIRKYKIL